MWQRHYQSLKHGITMRAAPLFREDHLMAGRELWVINEGQKKMHWQIRDRIQHLHAFQRRWIAGNHAELAPKL